MIAGSIMSESEQGICKYAPCGRPLPPPNGRNHRRREYCNDVHRQLAYRQRREQAARTEVTQRWSEFSPETQAALADILQLHGEAFAGRVAQVIAHEVARLQDAQQHVQKIEERFRADVTVHHFKKWLRTHDQPRDTEFFRRFLADTRLPQFASRALYEARLRLHGYSAEDIFLFQGAWKEMLRMQL
jgi:hypothetical protein